MARFYFDTNDGKAWMKDTFGLDLHDPEAALHAAVDTLPDLARHTMPDGDHGTFAVRVRDANGAPILNATLTLAVEWFSPASPA